VTNVQCDRVNRAHETSSCWSPWSLATVPWSTVSSITATFDVETKKHCLDVAIKEVIARQLADVMGRSRRSSDRVVLTPSERVSEGSSLVMDVSGDACDDLSIGQQQLSDRARSFGDGGVISLLPLNDSRG
jgi:hypothetical protein